jgi:threonine dehydratase
VEPAGAPKLHHSLAAGAPVRLDRTASIADGLITLTVGEVPFAELARAKDRLRGVVLVEDSSIRAAMQFLWRTCRLAVEPSGAATTAALLAGAVPRSRTTVLVVSGGNVDRSLLEATD